MLKKEYPYSQGIEGFKGFISSYPEFTLCPYIADKDQESWDKSTSRIYMNQVLPNFLYVPVNIPKEDFGQLSKLIRYIMAMDRVAAVNITQPHKSSPILRKIFFGDESSTDNIDTLMRDSHGRLAPYDLNALAFVEWFKEEVGNFEDRTVLLIGVGGVGEPIAKHITRQRPSHLILIDPINKTGLTKVLSAQTSVEYYASLEECKEALPAGAIVINAAGKEGVSDNSGIEELVERYARTNRVLVDIRPQIHIELVGQAKKLGS